jgi:hypothetical protein
VVADPTDPQAIVETFLAALAANDGATAGRLLDPDVAYTTSACRRSADVAGSSGSFLRSPDSTTPSRCTGTR